MVGSPIMNNGNNIMGGPNSKNKLVLSKNGELNGASYERFGRHNNNVATIGGPATTSAIQAQANQLVFSPTA